MGSTADQPRSLLFVETLGRVAILCDGRPREGSSLAPVRTAVLVVLAVERSISRDEMLALFWPESPDRKARHSLNQALHRLRSDYGDTWLRVRGDRLEATDALRADVGAFLAAVEAEDPGRAVALYEGRFLQGARLADSRPFEEWADRWDARLAGLFRDSCRSAIEQQAAAGDLDAALEAARRWVRIDPFAEEPRHRVVELLTAAGTVPEALAQIERYRRVLAEEDLELPEAIVALGQRLRTRSDSPAPLAIGEGPDKSPVDAIPEQDAAPPPEGGRRPPWRVSWGTIAIGVLSIAIVVTIAIDRFGAPPADPADRTVLVTPLQNYSADSTLTPLGRMAADWISQAAARHGIRVIPTIEVMHEVATAGTSFPTDARAVASRVDADLLVTGHYTLEGEDLVVRAMVSDLDSDRVWGPLPPVRAPVDSPGIALARIEQHVTGLLVSQIGPRLAVEPPTVLHPPTLDAYEAFLAGADRFIQGEYREALPHLAQAYQRDSTFARAALVAASAYLNLGNPRGADSIARLLQGRSVDLAPYETAHLRCLRALLSGDRVGALEAATTAADLAPGGPITGVAALLALELGQPERALDLADRIDPDHGWAARIPAYWSTRTRVLHATGRHQEELRVARSPGAAKWPLSSRSWEIRALAGLERWSAIRESVRAASALPQDRRLEFGRFLSDAALEVAAHGDSVLARELFSRAASWYEERVARDHADAAAVAYAQVLFRMGEDRSALDHYRVLAVRYPDRLSVLGGLAVLHARMGRADSARQLARDLSDPPFVHGEASMWRARVEAALGDAESAVGFVRRALHEGYPRRFQLHVDPDLAPLLRQPPDRDILVTSG